jgi:hypothetical protein
MFTPDDDLQLWKLRRRRERKRSARTRLQILAYVGLILGVSLGAGIGAATRDSFAPISTITDHVLGGLVWGALSGAIGLWFVLLLLTKLILGDVFSLSGLYNIARGQEPLDPDAISNEPNPFGVAACVSLTATVIFSVIGATRGISGQIPMRTSTFFASGLGVLVSVGFSFWFYRRARQGVPQCEDDETD